MSTKLKIGTRGSPLALTQASMLRKLLAEAWPDLEMETVVITTSGDRMQTTDEKPTESTKAIFTKEIEEALLEKRIDVAVHSAKDLGVEMPKELALVGVLSRAPVHDVVISRVPLTDLFEKESPVLATGSLRRQYQWNERYPKARFVPVRGNIDTRIRKLRENPDWDGIVLANAGLERLRPDVSGLIVSPLDVSFIIPAPCQGAIALQARELDADARHLVDRICHRPSLTQVRAERAFLETLGAGCHAPVGALARIYDGVCLHLTAVYYREKGAPGVRKTISGSALMAVDLGQRLANMILA